jgi:prepilin-type processing-associated H-X9-DG protein
MKTGANKRYQVGGFTRPDAMALVGTTLLLGGFVWLGIVAAGERRRTFVCAHRMKTLGQAFAEFAKDHKHTLPPAVFDDGQNNTSWDREIAVYRKSEFGKQNSPGKQKALEVEVAPAFKCPSDEEPRGGAMPRSYSMPMYDINTSGWPPDENCLGGVGLYLDAKRLDKARKAMPAESSDYVPAIKLSVIPAPADTALFMERISIQNALWATRFACVVSIKEQFDAKTFEPLDFHGDKMNYLLLDGHVELLARAQSAGFIGTGSLWTIWPVD